MSMLPGFSMNAFSQIGARFAIPFIFVMILFFAILSFTINLVAKIIRVKDKSFDSSMSLVAIAFIPSSVMILIGTILGFIFMPLAMLTHAISAMTLLLALYLGLQKHLGRPEKSPFWILPLMLIAMFIVFTIVLSIFAKIYYQMMMNALQRDLMNQFKGNGLNLFE